MPSLTVTVTVPSFATVIVAFAGRFGFAFLTASFTLAFSSSVKLDGSFTSTGVVGALISDSFPAFVFCSTRSLPLIVSVDLSGYVIVAVPSFPTSTLVPCGNLSLLASSTAFLTSAFSSSVNLPLLPTCVFAGTVGSVFSASVFSASVF